MIERAVEILRNAGSLTVLTGAGISAESGVPTFRGKDGLWRKYRAEELATWNAFQRDPELVWEWYDMRRGLINDAEINQGHIIIAEMEKHYDDFVLITQNVDGLHRKAGNKNIIELHGNLWRVRCLSEDKVFEFKEVPLKIIPPKCSCGSLLRPDVVWFNEPMPQLEIHRACNASEGCDVMLVVGTSAVVQPAASLPIIAKNAGAKVVELNVAATPLTGLVDVSIKGKAGEMLPLIWRQVMEK